MKLRLDELCEFVNGGAWSDREYVSSGIPVLKVSNLQREGIAYDNVDFIQESSRPKYARHLLLEDDLVIATVGSHPSLINSAAGRATIIPKSAAGYLLNQNAVCIRTKDSLMLDQKFLAYHGKTEAFQHFIQQRGKGAANQMRIAIGAIKEFEIELPSIDTQRRVATILSSFDNKIETNLTLIKLLTELAKLHFNEFQGGLAELSPFTLDEISNYLGRGVTPAYEDGSGFWAINQKANKGTFLETEHFKEYKGGNWVPEEKFAKHGDILINCLGEGTIGRCHYYKWDSDIHPVDQHMTIFRGRTKEIGLYVYLFLGTNMTMLNISDIRSIRIQLPSDKELRALYKITEPLYARKAILEKQNRLLKEARDILLPRLISGAIDVSEPVERLALAAEPKTKYRN